MPKNELGKIYDALKIRVKEEGFEIENDREYYLLIGQLLQFYKKCNNKAPFNFNTYADAKTDRVLKNKLDQILKHFNFGKTNTGVLLEKCYLKVKEYTPQNKGVADQTYLVGGTVLDLFN